MLMFVTMYRVKRSDGRENFSGNMNLKSSTFTFVCYVSRFFFLSHRLRSQTVLMKTIHAIAKKS